MTHLIIWLALQLPLGAAVGAYLAHHAETEG